MTCPDEEMRWVRTHITVDHLVVDPEDYVDNPERNGGAAYALAREFAHVHVYADNVRCGFEVVDVSHEVAPPR